MITSTPELHGGWHLPAVAAAQAELIERELVEPADVPPFANFYRALIKLPWSRGPAQSLLDLGCGVGHYGTLVGLVNGMATSDGQILNLVYAGVDASAAMIEIARRREPKLRFSVLPLEQCGMQADIVLASQCAEVTADPPAAMRRILQLAPGYVIWHRVRLADVTGPIHEPTYAGQMGTNYVWSLKDALDMAHGDGREFRYVELLSWPERADIITLICHPKEHA